MITGRVTSGEVRITIAVRDAAGQPQDIEAVIDTGFDGALTLPHSIIEKLGLDWAGVDELFLADGTRQSFAVYEATVIFGEVISQFYIEEVQTTPLVGMKLLNGHDLYIRCEEGGRVEIKKM